VCAYITKNLSLLSSAAPVSISLVVQYSNTRSKALTAFCQKRILPFSKPTDTVKREAHNFTSALLYKAGVFIRTRKCGLSWHPNSSTLCTKHLRCSITYLVWKKETLEQRLCCSLRTQLELNFCGSLCFLWCIRRALLQFLSLELIRNTVLFYLFLFLLRGTEKDKTIIFT